MAAFPCDWGELGRKAVPSHSRSQPQAESSQGPSATTWLAVSWAGEAPFLGEKCLLVRSSSSSWLVQLLPGPPHSEIFNSCGFSSPLTPQLAAATLEVCWWHH